MRWFKEFLPYLAGAVADDTATLSTPISIHVSCDAVETVPEVLSWHGMDFGIAKRCVKFSKHFMYLSTLIFCYENCGVEVTIFTLRQQYQCPKSKNRRAQRMNIKTLTDSLQQNQQSSENNGYGISV